MMVTIACRKRVKMSRMHGCYQTEEAQEFRPLAEFAYHRLEARLFPARPTVPAQARPAPEWAAIHNELRSQKHVTLQLLWPEYKQSNPDGSASN
jgi:transposase